MAKRSDEHVVMTKAESNQLWLFVFAGIVMTGFMLFLPLLINFFVAPFGRVGGRTRSVLLMLGAGGLTWVALKNSNGNRKVEALGYAFGGATLYGAWNALGYSDSSGGAIARQYALNMNEEKSEVEQSTLA